MSKSVENAMNTLKKALKNDESYAWSWHCNLAMAFFDAMKRPNHKEANEGASRFMKLAFDVETSYEKEPK